MRLGEFGPLGHSKMTDDGGCSLCKDESHPKKTLHCSVDIKAHRVRLLLGLVTLQTEQNLGVYTCRFQNSIYQMINFSLRSAGMAECLINFKYTLFGQPNHMDGKYCLSWQTG